MGRPVHKKYFGNLNSSGIGGESVASIAVGGAGANVGYTAVPALAIAAPGLPGGVQAVARAHMAVNAATNFSAGTSGYTPGQVLTLTGGTGTQATITVTKTKVNTVAIGDNRGSGYAPANVVTIDGGTGTGATVTVVSTRVKSATVNAGGDGYAVGDTIELTTGVSTTDPAQFTVTKIVADAATGPIETVALVPGVLGNYTTNPTLTGSGTAKSGGSGNNAATLNLVMEASTIEWTSGGSYTANPTLTNATTTPVAPATGTGLTVTVTMNIDAIEITTGGDYTALPADVTIVGHSGSGGATFNLTYKVLSAEVTTAGGGYATTPAVTETPDGGATYTVSLTTSGASSIAVSANTTGAGAKASDVVKQAASRRYLVTTSDGTAQCTLVAAAPGAGEMTMTAKDSAGGTYYVTKLTARRAVIVKGDRDGTQFTTGSDGISVPWVFYPNTAVLDQSVEIASV